MKSVAATPICKCCFRDIRPYSFGTLLSDGDEPICPKCHQEMKPMVQKFVLEGLNSMSLFPYTESFRSRLYALKGQRDAEMAPIFLAYSSALLRAMFMGYTIVPAPSYEERDKERGYNHVEEIYRSLGLPIKKALRKTEDVKQAGRSKEERSTIGEVLELTEPQFIRNKKILFVDDVITTGATAEACLRLLKEAKPKRLRALFLAKVAEKDGEGAEGI